MSSNSTSANAPRCLGSERHLGDGALETVLAELGVFAFLELLSKLSRQHIRLAYTTLV
jgi:hypothetical protein